MNQKHDDAADPINPTEEEIKTVFDEKPDLGYEAAYRIALDRKEQEWIDQQQKKPNSAKEILEAEKKLKEIDIPEAKKKFKNPDLLLNIKKELDKDHVGDDKTKLFLFCCSCSSRLKPNYRFSTAITGDSSEGKTNVWKTIKKHLPDEWFLDLTRITGSSLEDDIKEYDLIYFGEGNFDKGANASIIEQIKQLVEDGMDVIKKDARTNFKQTRREKQPRKVGIYSTTRNCNDEELNSRYCVASTHGSPEKYDRVNKDTLRTAADLNKEIDRLKREDWYTWITLGLRELNKYDIIKIPFGELLSVDSRSPRSQRDLKRFLNLIRVLAWICQYNRLRFSHRGYEILVASPEDFYNAMMIGKEIFDQSFSGLEPRLMEVIESYNKLKDTEIKQTFEDEPKELVWIDRSKIQRDLGIKTRDTMISRFKKLCADLNIFAYKNCGSRSYVAMKNYDSPSNLPSIYPLITVDANMGYRFIKDNYRRILKDVFDGVSTVDFSLLDEYKTNLLSLKNFTVEKAPSTHIDGGLIAELQSKMPKFDGSHSTVEQDSIDDDTINIDGYSFSPDDIYKVMVTKPTYEWHHTEITQGLNYSPSKGKEVYDFLKKLTADPKNETGITRSHEEGYYRLTITKGVGSSNA